MRRLQCVDESCEEYIAFPSFNDALKRISKGGLHFYNGIDATSPHLHIGHTIPLLLMKDIASYGNRITILFGDFTSRIGDPTDKLATRTAQSEDEVAGHLTTYVEQVEKILPKGSFEIRYNSEWLQDMTFGAITDVASHVTVQQMMARDMFQKRVQSEKPIFVSEFLYPLMQGYDSVAMDIDGEVGGNDQTFNMLVGRDLLKAYRQKDKIVLPVRLLVDAATGRKISKSEGGSIALDDEPSVIYEKVSRSIPNEMIRTVFELCTEVPMDAIEKHYTEASHANDWRSYNLSLAKELVRMYHGEHAAKKAMKQYGQAAKGEASDDEAVTLTGSANTSMVQLLSQALDISKSEAKRLITQRAVTKNGELVTDALGPSGSKNGDVLRVGSHRPFRIALKGE